MSTNFTTEAECCGCESAGIVLLDSKNVNAKHRLSGKIETSRIVYRLRLISDYKEAVQDNAGFGLKSGERDARSL